MKPGIFYLYEYNNIQKLRNTGFLKLTPHYHSCTLQLNARGISVSCADTATLYIFYMKNNLTEAAPLTAITCSNRALSARLTLTESNFPDGHTLEKTDGFFLLLPNGHILAAAAPGIAIDVQKLLSACGSSASAENPSDNAEAPQEASAPDAVQPPAETESEAALETVPAFETPAESALENESSSGSEMKMALSDNENTAAEIPTTPETLNPPAAPVTQRFLSGQNCSAGQESCGRQDSTAEQEPSYSAMQEPSGRQDCSAVQKPSDRQDCSAEQEPSGTQDSLAEQEPSGTQDSPAEQEPSGTQDSPTEQEPSGRQDSPAEQNPSDTSDSPTERTPSAGQNSSDMSDSPEAAHAGTEHVPVTEPASSSQESHRQNIRKIQRSEMSALPRRYWHLANNSFLLHGYHNYNHLLLIEKDGHYWLGVPGIYDPREARAARLFGFPQFTDSYNEVLSLSDDECAPHEKFGYWCCYLK